MDLPEMPEEAKNQIISMLITENAKLEVRLQRLLVAASELVRLCPAEVLAQWQANCNCARCVSLRQAPTLITDLEELLATAINSNEQEES